MSVNNSDFVEAVAKVMNAVQGTHYTCEKAETTNHTTGEKTNNRLVLNVSKISSESQKTYSLRIVVCSDGSIKFDFPQELTETLRKPVVEEFIKSYLDFNTLQEVKSTGTIKATYSVSKNDNFETAFFIFYFMLCLLK